MKLLDVRLLRQVPRVRHLLVLAAVSSMGQALAIVAQAVVVSRLIVRAFVDHWHVAQTSELLQWLALIIVARTVLGWAADQAAARGSALARSDLRKALLAAVAHGGPAVTREVEPGALAVLATKGIDSLDVYFSKVLPSLTIAAVVPAAAAGVIGYNDHLSLWIISATIPLVPFFMVLVGRETQLHASKQWQAMSRLAGHLLDVVSGLVTLHIFGRAQAQGESLRRSGDEYRRTTMKVLRVSFLSTLVLELLSTLSIALVAVSIGLRLVSGHMTLLAGLVVLLLAPEVYQPLRNIGTQFHAAADGLEAAGQALDIVELAQKCESEADAVIPPAGAPVAIELESVSFAYDDATAVLDHLSASFEPGRLYVLRGASGVGKSTLLHLLLGFLKPDSGLVRVCGVDAQTLDLQWWRAQVAYLPQRPWLPRGSVRSALQMVAPRADDEMLLGALASAGLAHGDAALPKGLDTELLDAGAGVSVGQMRRIALARALVLDRPVLLIDEPTAGLDAVASTSVVRAARKAADAGALVIVVSHSADFDAAADAVLDLDLVYV